MTILFRVEYDRTVMDSIGFVFKDEWLDNRTTFAQFPNLADREYLIEAVAMGALPAQRTSFDTLTIDDQKITVQIEWSNLEKAQEWAAKKLEAAVPGVLSSEVVVI